MMKQRLQPQPSPSRLAGGLRTQGWEMNTNMTKPKPAEGHSSAQESATVSQASWSEQMQLKLSSAELSTLCGRLSTRGNLLGPSPLSDQSPTGYGCIN